MLFSPIEKRKADLLSARSFRMQVKIGTGESNGMEHAVGGLAGGRRPHSP
jgi:hypothetical protein